MSEPRQVPDELELKKRARRRLVGAVAFATFAAVVLPMVMDETPPPSGRDIELRIPGQDQPAANPLTGARTVATTGAKALAGAAAMPPATAPAPTPATTAPAVAAPAAGSTPPAAKPAPAAALPAKPVPPADGGRTAATATKKDAPPEAKRAQSILDGQNADAGGAQVILIGAFANQANVKNLQTKLGQLGIKTYTESLESPQGRKTRVRAGPFANREAADKALEKMQRIGVNGVVAPKQ